MKKEGKISFLAALWWLVGLACLGTLIVLLTPATPRPSEAENRMLAGFPEFTLESLFSGTFFDEVEDYLSDGFLARADVVDASKQMLELFNQQTQNQRLIMEEAETDRLLIANNEGLTEPARATTMPTAPPSPVSTATPSPVSTATPSPTYTSTPLPSPTPAAAWMTPLSHTASPAPTPTAASTPSPAPSPTPKVIVPLDKDASYTLSLICREGGMEQIYAYPAENITTYAGHLNYLRQLLPEGGEVHFIQVPVAATANRLRLGTSCYSGWVSTMEDALASQVVDGVFIHNAPAILNDALMAWEDVFYYTDHHWTPLGAWYAYASITASRGYPVIPWEAYEYETRLMGKNASGREDWLHMLKPLAPVKSYILKHLTEAKEIAFMNYSATSYVGYINNTRTPWRQMVTGYGSDRRALVICDSFGNAFVPYLLPYYGQIHMTDLRIGYFDSAEAGGTFQELLRYHMIDDVYVIVATSGGINSGNSLITFRETISK